MPRYNILHYQNPTTDMETSFAYWQRTELPEKMLAVRGVQAMRHYNLQPVQLQPPNKQPYRLATVYEVETDDLTILLSEFNVLARGAAKQKGMLSSDVAHVYQLTRPLLFSPNPYDLAAPLHVAFVMGNCIEGKELEYDAWYDNVHSVEVLGTPGFFGMRRGIINDVQADPNDAQPANRLVLLMIRTHDLHAAIDEFIARAYGTSTSGIKWAPRESAAGFASLKRTTHVFSPYSPRLTNATAASLPEKEGQAQT